MENCLLLWIGLDKKVGNMAILLTNGTYYIAHNKSGAIIKVTDIEQAQDFHSVERAIHLKNKSPSKTKGYYYIDTSINDAEIKKGRLIYYVITDGSKYIGYDRKIKKNIIVDDYNDSVKLIYTRANSILKNLDRDILEAHNWKIISTIEAKEDLLSVMDFDIDSFMDSPDADFSLLIKRKKVLNLEYLKIEREITDIYHAMEFYNLDAAKGYKMYRMMHEILIRRRKNKDESLKIDYILAGGIKGLTNNTTKQRIEKLDNRHYQPRALKELFNV